MFLDVFWVWAKFNCAFGIATKDFCVFFRRRLDQVHFGWRPSKYAQGGFGRASGCIGKFWDT